MRRERQRDERWSNWPKRWNVDRETLLAELASAILEGKAIDWATVESTADPADSSVIQQLKLVSEIATLHRDFDAPDVPAASWGHLRLLERIGSGTFGDVYRAWDPHLDREVALKLLRAQPAPSAMDASLSDPARVVNEGRLLARVRHPHVITVYGAEPREGTVGIWMEFIRGKTLHEIVAQQGVMSAREATAVAADLCSALAAVHSSGLLHRDVTARNVMRADGGRIVLMDFGAGHDDARSLATGDERGMAGTPLYMAPELFAGARADQRSDIYALGALLYYLVTGQFPVTGKTLAEVRAAHGRGARTRLRDARPDLPAGFVRIVEKALDPNPSQRFQTAGELEQALEDPASLNGAGAGTSRPRAVYAAAALTLSIVVISAVTLLWSPGGGNQRSGMANPQTGTIAGGLATQKLAPTGDVWAFSNPTDDGRYMAGMVGQTGDAALVDVATGTYRTLGIGRGDYSDGWATRGIISPDGSTVAIEWYVDNVGSLKLVNADGSGRRDLVPPPADVRAYQFSRDGTLILAAVALDRDTNAVCLIAVADGAMRQIRTIGRVLPAHMSLSPDGRYIAYDNPESAGTIERDIFILDAHTNTQWALVASPGEDRSPFWTPDGKNVVFLSDRSRTLSLWMMPVTQGRAIGEPQLLKDDLGRSWLSGFTSTGRLFYVLASGHAEVYVASLNDAKMKPQAVSPRLALSNFYPEWSQDGRYVAYSSERSNNGREIWVHDTQLQTDQQITSVESRVGRPFGWSPDGSSILTRGTEEQQLYLVDRASGAIKVIAENAVRASWGPSGILYRRGKQAELYDPAGSRVSRSFDYRDPSFAGFEAAWDGRSIIAVRKGGNILVEDLGGRRRHEWQDSGVSSIGNHFMAPHAVGVAYVATRPSMAGPVKTLMYWGGAGPPRELLRSNPKEDFILAGWHGDGRQLLVVRFNPRPEPELRNETLWRVPIDGSDAVTTGLTMEGLRDISIHPDGHQIAFNAGWKKNEHWVMDNLLPK
jgi:serine/threonine-protein kinase